MNSDDIIEINTFSTDAERKFLVPSRAAMNKLPKPGALYSAVLPGLVAANEPPHELPLKPGTILATVRFVRKAT
jgi:hypothetical protein